MNFTNFINLTNFTNYTQKRLTNKNCQPRF